MRFEYDRIDAARFRRELAVLNMQPGAFARIFGVNLNVVKRWTRGEQDIPPWVRTVTAMMIDDAGMIVVARRAAATAIKLDKLHPERGEYPYHARRELPTDLEAGDD
ncbi:hypothetical protein [Bosea massiliensis]|uniref:Transcriptional regulator n=1 Tax=Bosea massiliensis TaxID=151419 RepID=A0ABW0PCQ2_9HYPH